MHGGAINLIKAEGGEREDSYGSMAWKKKRAKEEGRGKEKKKDVSVSVSGSGGSGVRVHLGRVRL